QISRADLFTYLETELKELETLLPEPRTGEYGRADRGAAWTLLAKLYINAKIYTGTDKNTETITYCNKLISSAAYTLEADYSRLFKTDNNLTTEIIFPIMADGVTSQSYGNTTYILLGSLGGTMNPADYGVSTTWGGMRTTKNVVDRFPDPFGTADKRAIFYTSGQNLDISDLSSFNDGYAVPKFKNISSTGQPGSDPTKRFTDTDFPMFRFADVYLMYAEAVVRGGAGGSVGEAVNYVNLLRRRAYGDNSGDISAGQLTLDFLLDERGRELYWEATRRTDLVRFGKLTSGSYLWPFKGGVAAGTAVQEKYNVFPIPNTDRIANPNLVQNDGY
ncbi:MAG TPA: RagB/SusD family nutrient uptake outer membrane protein, partial [Chitinophaga sp.]|nr:RagB/SusD family nutrient uptake outer membrane protein [Chitinophaga sp.]